MESPGSITLRQLWEQKIDTNCCLVVQDLQENVCSESLRNYLEVVCRNDVEAFHFPALVHGPAIVVFQDKISDMKLIQTNLEKRLFDSKKLKLCHLGELTGLFLWELPQEVSKDYLELYFENKKSSGGCEECVQDVQIWSSLGIAVVVFSSQMKKVLEAVLQREHRYKHTHVLKVEPYFPAFHDHVLEMLTSDTHKKSPKTPVKQEIKPEPKTASDTSSQIAVQTSVPKESAVTRVSIETEDIKPVLSAPPPDTSAVKDVSFPQERNTDALPASSQVLYSSSPPLPYRPPVPPRKFGKKQNIQSDTQPTPKDAVQRPKWPSGKKMKGSCSNLKIIFDDDEEEDEDEEDEEELTEDVQYESQNICQAADEVFVSRDVRNVPVSQMRPVHQIPDSPVIDKPHEFPQKNSDTDQDRTGQDRKHRKQKPYRRRSCGRDARKNSDSSLDQPVIPENAIELSLKREQIILLKIGSFSKRVKACRITLDESACKITFTGTGDNIQGAQLKMYEILDNVYESSETLTEIMAALLSKKETMNVLRNRIKGQKIYAVIDAKEGRLWCWALKEQEVQKGITFAKETVMKTALDLREGQEACVQSTAWSEFIGRVEADLTVIVIQVILDERKVAIVGLSPAVVTKARQQVVEYLKQFTSKQSWSVDVTGAKSRCFQELFQKDLELRIRLLRGQMKVEQTRDSSFSIKVTISGSSAAWKATQECVNAIWHERLDLKKISADDSDVQLLLRGLKTVGFVKEMEVKFQCFIEILGSKAQDSTHVEFRELTPSIQQRRQSEERSMMATVPVSDKRTYEKETRDSEEESSISSCQHQQDLTEADEGTQSSRGRFQRFAVADDTYSLFQGELSERDALHVALQESMEQGDSDLNTDTAVSQDRDFGEEVEQPFEKDISTFEQSTIDTPPSLLRYRRVRNAEPADPQRVQETMYEMQQSVFSLQPEYVVPQPQRGMQLKRQAYHHRGIIRGDRGIEVEEEEEEDLSGPPVTMVSGCTTIQIKQGDITKERADALVNVVGPLPERNFKQSVIAKSFLKAEGPQLEQLYEDEKQRNCAGVIRTDSPGNLPCQFVLHVSMKKKDSNVEKVIGTAVQGCLQSSSDFRSIAFPPLGCGRLYGYQATDVAKWMLLQLEVELRNRQYPNLKNVAVVAFDRQEYNTFKSALVQLRDGTLPRLTARRSVNQMSPLQTTLQIQQQPQATRNTSAAYLTPLERRFKLHQIEAREERERRGLATIQRFFQKPTGSQGVKLSPSNPEGLYKQGQGQVLGTRVSGIRPIPRTRSTPQLPTENRQTRHEQSEQHHGYRQQTSGQGLKPQNTETSKTETSSSRKSVQHSTALPMVKVVVYGKDKESTERARNCIGKEMKDMFLHNEVLEKKGELSSESKGKIRDVIQKRRLQKLPGRSNKQYIIRGHKKDVHEAQVAILKIMSDQQPTSEVKSNRAHRHKLKRKTMEFCRFMALEDISETPNYWKYFHPGEPVKNAIGKLKLLVKDRRHFKVDLDPTSSTFRAILSMIQHTWDQQKIGQGKDARNLDRLGYTRLVVKKIQRIENLELYDAFCNRRKMLFRNLWTQDIERYPAVHKLPDCSGPIQTKKCGRTLKEDMLSEINEYLFFHGTKAEIVDTICNQGLDSRLGSDKAMFGPGVYGAESVTKADQYADDKDQRQKPDRKVFLIRMALGNAYVCNSQNPPKYRRPPCATMSCRKDACEHSVRFDSVVGDNGKLFREFVVYDAAQCYPEYLITYDRQ